MDKIEYRVTPYRWAVLAAVMIVNMTIQALWIGYAPVTAAAANLYGVSDMAVGFFAMSFMIIFIPLSIPASWLIDRFGFIKSVGIGSAVVGIFGVLRGLAGADYRLAMLATCGIAAAQPLLLNAWTKMPADWFPAGERATAVGLTTLASIVGTAVAMVLSPVLTARIGLLRTQLWYGIAAAAAAICFFALARERPRVPPDASASGERALMLEGLKHALGLPSFRRYLLMAFIGMGVFNGVTTWIEAIVRPRGIGPEMAGALGAVMLGAGVVGAVLVPLISDRVGRRKPFIALGLGLTVPGLVGIAFAGSFPLLVAACALLGFGLVAANPVGMQYVAEATRPTPEGSSNGLVSLAGQASVLLVWAMEALSVVIGGFALSLSICAALMGLSTVLALSLREPGGRAAAGR